MTYVKCVNRDTLEETLCSECRDNTGFYDSCLAHTRKHYTWIVDDKDNIVWHWGEPHYGKYSEMIKKRKEA